VNILTGGHRMVEKNKILKKCYANKIGNKCKILATNKCFGAECSFYKTHEQHKESCKKSRERLRGLDKLHQQYLADKYYGGKRVWLKGE